jgi:hypothetical protein
MTDPLLNGHFQENTWPGSTRKALRLCGQICTLILQRQNSSGLSGFSFGSRLSPLSKADWSIHSARALQTPAISTQKAQRHNQLYLLRRWKSLLSAGEELFGSLMSIPPSLHCKNLCRAHSLALGCFARPLGIDINDPNSSSPEQIAWYLESHCIRLVFLSFSHIWKPKVKLQVMEEERFGQ